jgi:uncharacterized damage-inducible protein DinB
MSKSPETIAKIEAEKNHLQQTHMRLLGALKHTPESHLNWTPSETAKSALAIAIHAAQANRMFASRIRQEPMPPISMDEIAAMSKAEAESITTLEAATKFIDESVALVSAALDNLDDESINLESVPSPFFSAPMAFWAHLPARHMETHAGQIDYIQTIYGDMVWHMS